MSDVTNFRRATVGRSVETGRILIESLRDEGYDHMIIDWTDLVDYYAKFGFEPWLEYDVLQKEL